VYLIFSAIENELYDLYIWISGVLYFSILVIEESVRGEMQSPWYAFVSLWKLVTWGDSAKYKDKKCFD
jgi:hypothetical protein